MNTSRPSDSYDQLYFQDLYGKPRPEFWRPDPYHPPLPGDEIQDIYGPKPVRPLRPEYVPERPQYQYIIRPNKRPYKPVLEDQGYNQVKPLYPNRPEYGSGINDPDRPYRPSRPYDKPSYTYTGQYASNYGTSQDNSIKVEIYDPPRPYRPSTSQRPYHESPENGEIYGQGYGYNSYSNQQSFSQSAAQYGSSSWSQNNQGYKPQKPSYGTVSYEDNENDDAGYGPKPPKPKPSLSSGSYGNQHDQSGYGESSSNQGYGGQTTSNNGYGGETSLNNQGYGHNSYGGQASSNNQGYGQSSYGGQPSSNSGYGGQTSSVNGYGGQSSSTDSYASQISSTNSYGGQSSSNNGYESQSSSNNGYGGQSDSNNGYGGYRNDVKDSKDQKRNKPDHVSSRLDVKPVYEPEPGKLNGERVTSRPVAVGGSRNPKPGETYEPCFRRVLAGRRALRSHVRKVVNCERLEDCRRECAEERRFHCESFNYRLDPTFRGKGLCELMTKPIEAFDLQEDFVEDKEYDFYELDRNSLEPYCPETLRGPGLLHSGYLSSKPEKVPGQDNQWRDRNDWSMNGYKSYNRFFDEKRTQTYNRRYEDQLYVPYQIGVIKKQENRRSDENWGQYGGNYGGIHTSYKDGNDYHNSKNHWAITEPYYSYHGVKHHNEKEDFNYHSLQKNSEWQDYGYGYGSWKTGRWNSSGSFWKEIADAGFSKHGAHEFEGRTDESTKDCSSRRRPGMSLGSGAIRRSLLAHTVVECEAACFGEREFKCVSYSYRYSSIPGKDNCFLSERPYRGLEMSSDSGSDVYAMPLHQDCLTISTKPWVESECFWHVRSGAAVSGKAVRAAITVTGLGACEAECIRAHTFFCRGFSFRFDAPTIGDDLENCLLTSSPPTSLELNHGLSPNKHELYSRGNYGRGCEPALYDDVNREPQCYLQYESAAKLTPISIRGRAHAKDERACGHACTDAPFTCLSFSFNNNAPPDSENCLLSEIRLFDLQRGVDYEHSVDDLLFAFDLFNGQCWRKVHVKGEHDVPSLEVPRPLSAPALEETYPGPVSAPDFHPPPPETYIISSGPTGPEYHGAEPPKPYISETGYKPGYNVGPPLKPSYLPSGPDSTGPSGPPSYSPGSNFKPSYPPVDLEPHPPIYEPYRPSYKPSYKPEYIPSGQSEPGFKPSGYKPSYPSGPSYSSYGPAYPPYNQDRPNYKPSYIPSGPEFKPQGSGGRPGGYPAQEVGYRPQKPRPVDKIDNSLSVSWRHYTVSGFPCRKGTTCEQNIIAGHWACEPEGGEIGSWDYCCAATHRCGYSEGFQKPWCYVGPSHEQWRPCSEKYYPYHQHNVPHPSQGQREAIRPRPDQNQKPLEKPSFIPAERDRHSTSYPGGYLTEGDRRYWDDIYKNGPQAYYDKSGNPLPGYTRVPIEDRPHIKYQRNPSRPGSGYWVPVSSPGDDEPPAAGGLGVPRYWPVAYLHKGPPPNMSYFRYNETTTTERYPDPRPQNENPDTKRVNLDKPAANDLESRSIENSPRAEKRINITGDDDDIYELKVDNQTTTTYKPENNETVILEPVTEKEIKVNNTGTQSIPVISNIEEDDIISGIDGKLHDFTKSIEVYDIDLVKEDKLPDFKTLEAEEKQIEAIGRLLASKRGGKLVIHKRSQKDLESKSISLDKDFIDFNFGNKFPTTERRGVIQKVSKEDIEKSKFLNDKSLEVSETTFVRPPRILSTTENIRKAVVNGKVFYDATIRDQRELYANSTRRAKNLRLQENRAPSVIPTISTKKKTIRTRNTNPVRRVRRVYKKKYNPEEVRKRLLEREKSKNITETIKS
ncbi:jg10337 [Pararge aegeria aegeria]|uniref:Jg10337 protein n=1 Tax=Pararge aegeria aegeria TaxID=348720 RepID=A0A8S4RNY8_9NEOP|nr:jg10337 [Pararge aegeria aegeria]